MTVKALVNQAAGLPSQQPDPLAYTPEQAAHALGISRASLYNLLQRGTLRSVRIGRLRRIPRTALEALLNPETGDGVY